MSVAESPVELIVSQMRVARIIVVVNSQAEIGFGGVDHGRKWDPSAFRLGAIIRVACQAAARW